MQKFNNDIFKRLYEYEKRRKEEQTKKPDFQRFQEGRPLSEEDRAEQLRRYRETLRVFHPDAGDLIELRTLKPDGELFSSAYVKDKDLTLKLASGCQYTIYSVFNRINDACFSRRQSDRFITARQERLKTTDQKDITNIDWLFIDVDPERTKGISSTDAEKEEALKVIISIIDYLKQSEFTEPVVCDSGNGYHLFIKTDLTPDKMPLVQSFVEVMHKAFSVPGKADVDQVVKSAAQMGKFYGTVSRKGTSTEDRPHRMTAVISAPETIEPTPEETIQRIIDELKETEPEQKTSTAAAQPSKGKFDINSFLSAHGVNVRKRSTKNGIEYLTIDNDPLDPEHHDNCVLVLPNGAMCYKNFHETGSTLKCYDHNYLRFLGSSVPSHFQNYFREASLLIRKDAFYRDFY